MPEQAPEVPEDGSSHEIAPQRSLRKRILQILALLLGVLLLFRLGQGVWTRLFPPPIQEIPPTKVSVIKLAPGPFERVVPVAGSLAPVQSADVYAKVGGKVTRVHVTLGQLVKAGQPLATVDSTEWGLQARQAEAGFSMADQAATVAQRSVERLDRVQQKVGPGVLTATEDETARLQAQGAVTQRDVARFQRDLAHQMVRNATMTAPIDGVVTKVYAQTGAMVGQDFPSFHVDDLSAFVLRCQLGDLELPLVQPGQQVRLRSDSIPDVPLSGKVTAVSPSLDAVTRRAPIEISVPGDKASIIGNVFVRGEVLVGEDPSALVLPTQVVERTLGEIRVQVVVDKKIAQRSLKILAESRQLLSVSGLSAGQLVVIPGAEHLADGEPVEVVQTLALDEVLHVAE